MLRDTANAKPLHSAAKTTNMHHLPAAEKDMHGVLQQQQQQQRSGGIVCVLPPSPPRRRAGGNLCSGIMRATLPSTPEGESEHLQDKAASRQTPTGIAVEHTRYHVSRNPCRDNTTPSGKAPASKKSGSQLGLVSGREAIGSRRGAPGHPQPAHPPRARLHVVGCSLEQNPRRAHHLNEYSVEPKFRK